MVQLAVLKRPNKAETVVHGWWLLSSIYILFFFSFFFFGEQQDFIPSTTVALVRMLMPLSYSIDFPGKICRSFKVPFPRLTTSSDDLYIFKSQTPPDQSEGELLPCNCIIELCVHFAGRLT